MKIETIDIYRVAMPLTYPFRTAFGNEFTIESVLVRFASQGISGWGEACSMKHPAYSSECAKSQFIISRDFIAPLLIAKEISSGRDLQNRLSGIKGNFFAKAGFDMAWWDLHCRLEETPLWNQIGGRNPVVEVGADFGIMESLDLLLETIEQAIREGYKRVKLKYRPGWELEMVATVCETFPDTTFHVDCNSAYTLDDMDMFRELDRFQLAMIEQPLGYDDLYDHARLQAALKTPVCLDESITSADKARKAVALQSCRWVNIKPGRVGGITPAIAIHDIFEKAGISCWIGGMLESAVGASHCLALATLPNIHYPSDIFPTDRFYERDLATPPMEHSAPGRFHVSDKPGMGAAPDPEMLASATIEHAELRVE